MDARALLLSVALLASALTGCSDGTASDGAAPSATGEATAATGSASADPGETGETEGAELPFPDVAPAAGIRLRHETVEMRAPEGWTSEPAVLAFQASAGRGTSLIVLSEMEAMGGQLPLDVDARIALRTLRQGGEGRRFPDVVLDGERAYHVGGARADGQVNHVFGLVHQGRLVQVKFSLDPGAGNPEQVVGSAMNTLRWR